MPTYGLGRIHLADFRDLAYPMRLGLDMAAALPAYKYWTPGPVLDQGQTSECVAFATTGWEEGSPIRDRASQIDTPDALYAKCQAVDGIRGPHEGSTVRAGLKVMQAEGRVANYLWAQSVDDIMRWLALNGPVIMGTSWYESMFSPTAGGVVVIDPGSQVAGGHAYLLNGYNKYGWIRGRNSWGAGWAKKGSFWIHKDTVARLLSEDGESCAAAERRV